MDLAIDALLQARNLDRVILLTGDGDFIRLVVALQNMGSRVEVIGFNNVSNQLKETADSYLSGYLVPGLLPIQGGPSENWQRGMAVSYNPERGFGFMRYFAIKPHGLTAETIFFHCSRSHVTHTALFLDPTAIFEFRIGVNSINNRTEAWDIRALDEPLPG
jgi:hypothetical protein